MQPREFLEDQGLEYRAAGSTEFQIEFCPFCASDGWHLYMNKDTGLYNCKKCDASGNQWTMKMHLTGGSAAKSVSDIMAQEQAEVYKDGLCEESVNRDSLALFGQPAALQWLFDRGLTKGTIRKFRLGYSVVDGLPMLCIPYFLKGVPVNIKYRTLPPYEKTFRVIKGRPTPLFNVDGMDPTESSTFVTEGEFDAMMLWQEGYHNVVSIPQGANSFSTEHFDSLVVCNKIYLCYDNDEVGLGGAKKVAGRLGAERCWYVKLPTKDINEFFLKHTKSDFEAVLQEAIILDKPDVMSLRYIFKDVLDKRKFDAGDTSVHLPWPNVDAAIGGLRPGWLVVLQAIPKIGKTTFCSNACFTLATQGIPTFLFSLELSPEELLEKVVAQHKKTPIKDVGDEDLITAQGMISHHPLYVGHTTRLEVQHVFDVIRYAVKRFGVRLVVFDHLHFLCRDTRNQVSEVGRIVRDFKMLFVELGVPGILVAHPKKQATNSIPGLFAARESGEIPGDADVVVSMFRQQMLEDGTEIKGEHYVNDQTPSFHQRTLIRVVASRHGPGGSATLYFHERGLQFSMTEEER